MGVVLCCVQTRACAHTRAQPATARGVVLTPELPPPWCSGVLAPELSLLLAQATSCCAYQQHSPPTHAPPWLLR
jgi:hypothetical protein